MERIEIGFREKTLEKVDTIVTFYNFRNKLVKEDMEEMTRESFIKGSVVGQINEIDSLFSLNQMNSDLPYESGVLKNRFKQIFSELGIKQNQISEITGIESSTLSYIFNNKTPLSLENFLKLWTLLNNPPIRTILYRE